MNTAVFVPLLLLGILGSQALLWIVVLRVRKGMVAQQATVMTAALAALASAAEPTVCPPTLCRVRRGHGTRQPVTAALTTGRLILVSRTRDEILLRDVTGVRADSTFTTSWRSGWRWLIVQLPTHEFAVGLREGDCDRWVEAMRVALASVRAANVG